MPPMMSSYIMLPWVALIVRWCSYCFERLVLSLCCLQWRPGGLCCTSTSGSSKGGQHMLELMVGSVALV